MFTTNPRIEKTQSVAEIVTRDYRTADVFRKYGIEYCCGGRAPLQMACVIRGIDEDKLISELEDCMREVNPSNTLDFNAWHIDFLTDYIVITTCG
jgi:regulator of cell morphogenesis and NO signaling